MMISLDPVFIQSAENQAKAGDTARKTVRPNEIQPEK